MPVGFPPRIFGVYDLLPLRGKVFDEVCHVYPKFTPPRYEMEGIWFSMILDSIAAAYQMGAGPAGGNFEGGRLGGDEVRYVGGTRLVVHSDLRHD